MRLIHYSAAPLKDLNRSKQPQVLEVLGETFKPRGLWVSVEGEDDWLSWCRAERFGLDCFACATLITLNPQNKVLCLSSAENLDWFTDLYKTPMYPGSGITWINWKAVREVYQGLIIAPYIWERRLTPNTFWYYGWDCASGCIWDADAVSHFEPIAAPDISVPPEELTEGKPC